eukprot:6488355-Amphidinium_carterae.1
MTEILEADYGGCNPVRYFRERNTHGRNFRIANNSPMSAEMAVDQMFLYYSIAIYKGTRAVNANHFALKAMTMWTDTGIESDNAQAMCNTILAGSEADEGQWNEGCNNKRIRGQTVTILKIVGE